jgi:hypothetical protein
MLDKERENAIIEIQESAKRMGHEIDRQTAEQVLNKCVATEEKRMLEGEGGVKPKGLL